MKRKARTPTSLAAEDVREVRSTRVAARLGRLGGEGQAEGVRGRYGKIALHNSLRPEARGILGPPSEDLVRLHAVPTDAKARVAFCRAYDAAFRATAKKLLAAR